MADEVLRVGLKAKAFTLPNQDGDKVKLSDYKGKWLVFYSYPKDLTPGCTTEAIEFTQFKPEFDKIGVEILGISPDSPEKHCKFIEKKELGIDLLSDQDHAVIEKYGMWQLKKFMGREFMGVVRTTFIIDPDGRIAEVWSPVKVKGHVEAVLARAKELVEG